MATTSSGADPAMVSKIANHLKSQGIFDQFRRDCLEDVDTKPAYQNLRQKVENYVSTFLSKVKWEPKMNKNQLRDSLRRQINQSEMLSTGVERIIEQVIEPKMQHVFRPQIEKVVAEFLSPEKNKNVESVKKDLSSTSGWQGDPHQTFAPVPPDPPPRVPSPAPPLPPSEPPAAPPEAPPDSPPAEPEIPSKSFYPGTSPKVSPATEGSITPTFPSGGNTPSSTSSKGRETPNLPKKQSGGILSTSVDVKVDKNPEASSEGVSKPTSQSSKGHSVKKSVGRDSQLKLIKKFELGSKDKPKPLGVGAKVADNVKAADKSKAFTPDKPKVNIPYKATSPKAVKAVADKKEKESDVPVKKPSQDSASRIPSSEVELELQDVKVLSAVKTYPKPEMMDTQDDMDKLNLESVESKEDAGLDLNVDHEMVHSEHVEMPSGNESDGESGLSDISVSSVHTSDLSSFDEDISSTSSSSSVESSSDEDTGLKLVLKKKKPIVNVCPSDSDSEALSEGPSEMTVSTDTSRPASVSSDRTSSRRSPKGQTATGRALAISRYHGDSEDEDSRQERRKKAALAKEERAQRRQLAKEEREKFVRVTRQKRIIDSESLEESSDSKKGKREEAVSPTKATKKQLKEQKMLEKKREVRRRRSLNKRYFSDEFSSSMQGLKETVSQQEEEEERALQENPPLPEFIPVRAFIRKEKLQCFHLVYRERREPQVRCHHLLNLGLSGEQQRKQSTRKRKERKDCKISKFSFPQAKATAGASEGNKGKQVGEKQHLDSAQQHEQQKQDKLQQQQQKKLPQQEQPLQGPQQPQQDQDQQRKPEKQQQLQQKQHGQQEERLQGQHPPGGLQQDDSVEKETHQLPKKEETPPQQVEQNEEETLENLENPEELVQSEAVEKHPSQEQPEKLEGVEEDAKMEVDAHPSEKCEKDEEQDAERLVQDIEKPVQDIEKPVQGKEKQEDEEMQKLDEGQDGEENKKSDETNMHEKSEGETLKCNIDSPLEEEVAKETLMMEANEEAEPPKEDPSLDDSQTDVTSQIDAPKETPSDQTTTTLQEVSIAGNTLVQKSVEPTDDVEPAAAENTSDDNPPTPTQDEPAIYSESDSESEEQSDKGSSIPIYTVHSPKHLPLGSIFKLSQSSLQDVKPVGSRVGEVRTLSKDSSASGSDDARDPVTVGLEIENTGGEDYQGTTESSRDSDKQDPEETHAEHDDEPSTSEISEPTQPESRYGTRPKRHAVSPRDSIDDDYYYYGQSKRGRYSQSPVSQDEPVKPGRSVTRRMSTDSGKSEGTSREVPDRPTRPSRQRHISPPHRYSPSETRTSGRRSSTSSPHPPAAPNASAKPTRRGLSPSSHEHFTRRSSTREEVKRSNRYSDMYYYNDRGSRNQPATRGGDRGRASEPPVSSRRSSRRSVDDRASNQAKRRK